MTRHSVELGYLGVSIADGERPAFDDFLADIVGLEPGTATPDGHATWRNDAKAQRLIVDTAATGASDAAVLGFEAQDEDAFVATIARLTSAGYTPVAGADDERAERRVADLVHLSAPWGVRVEVVHGMAEVAEPFVSARVAGGFLTKGMGFGHVVFGTTAFDESHRFVTDGLGLRQTDWVEIEIAAGIELEVRFYHCNARHHSLALAHTPFELPQRLHHFMVEVNDRDDVGRAFDRAWSGGLGIANGLGRHDNDGMFSFYVVSPAGFQVEVGHGARTVTEPWDDNRRYDRISIWGHQPLHQGASG